MIKCEITLEQMLMARDDRAEKQKKLIMTYSLPLISFTVNMPGPGKNTDMAGSIFTEGCSVLMSRLKDRGVLPACLEMRDLPTGMEAYVVVDLEEPALKKLTLEIEESHPLGRLWDFDVIGRKGLPVSREALGYSRRKCLICDRDAHACARSRAHSLEELLKKIQSMADEYFNKNGK